MRTVIALAAALAACSSTPEAPRDAASAPSPDVRPDLAAPAVCNAIAPTACVEPAPRYADLEAVFESKCVVCHSGVPDGPWPLRGYSHVADWRDSIRAHLLDCTMPPPDAATPISEEERAAILMWLRCGLPK